MFLVPRVSLLSAPWCFGQGGKERDTGYIGPLKAWNFIVSCIFQDWKVLEKATGPGKLWKSVKL